MPLRYYGHSQKLRAEGLSVPRKRLETDVAGARSRQTSIWRQSKVGRLEAVIVLHEFRHRLAG
jgi:hypothetical protein